MSEQLQPGSLINSKQEVFNEAHPYIGAPDDILQLRAIKSSFTGLRVREYRYRINVKQIDKAHPCISWWEPMEPSNDVALDIIITNVVAVFRTRCHLNLRTIALEGVNVIYKPEYGKILMKLRKPRITASIWSSGKIICTGATSEEEAKQGARRLARTLQKLGFKVRFADFKVVNVLAVCSMPFAIRLIDFTKNNRPIASYEPELHPAATYRIKTLKATVQVFSTGSLTVTGPNVQTVATAVEHIYPLLKSNGQLPSSYRLVTCCYGDRHARLMNSHATMSPTAPVAMETLGMTSDLSAKSFQHGTLGHYTPLKAAPPNGTGCTWLVSLAAVAASLSGLMMGYELGLTSSVLLQIRGALSLSCREQELLVGSLLLGCLAGCLAGGWGLDRYGRRWAMLLSGGLVVGGTALLLLPASLTTLSLGRAVVGMGVALSGTAACLYIAEIAPRERRGLLVTLYELMVVVGVLLGFGCSYAFSTFPHGWRYTFGLVLPPTVLQAAALLLLPPSPRFLVARGDSERARAVLTLLRGVAGSEAVEEELRDIQAGLKEEAEHGFWELFSDKANLRWRLLTGVALVFLQQATGQPNVLSYASPLLRSMGFHSDAAATLASTGFGVVKVAGTVPAVLLVDRFGPRRFLCVGAVAMAMSLVTLGAVTFQSHTHLTSLCQSHAGTNSNTTHSGLDNGSIKLTTPFSVVDQWSSNDLSTTTSRLNSDSFKSTPLFPDENQWNASDSVKAVLSNREGAGIGSRVRSQDYMKVPPTLKWISLISLLVYVAAFSFSLGPMVYVVLSEIFPTGIRGKAVSVVSSVNWATNLLVSMTFLSITERIGVPNIMFLYAIMSFVLLVFVIFFIPETRGRTLEQISKELAKKKQLKLNPRKASAASLILALMRDESGEQPTEEETGSSVNSGSKTEAVDWTHSEPIRTQKTSETINNNMFVYSPAHKASRKAPLPNTTSQLFCHTAACGEPLERETKVCEYDVTLRVQQNVLRLQVSVNKMTGSEFRKVG
ncbi:hypothetical protein DPEC_G00081140 [Dallia pectoralis]|uniref:Uncharacterized protein n=1 Tax=Dallia pectoralis TaxID=75939 RepID=A0ACC2GYG0_DALPE|nr:hypothetical protein DPEC_G00081140 [Dallia pectoralis]